MKEEEKNVALLREELCNLINTFVHMEVGLFNYNRSYDPKQIWAVEIHFQKAKHLTQHMLKICDGNIGEDSN